MDLSKSLQFIVYVFLYNKIGNEILSENASTKTVTLFVYGEKYKTAAIVKVTIKRGNECHMFNLSYKSTRK